MRAWIGRRLICDPISYKAPTVEQPSSFKLKLSTSGIQPRKESISKNSCQLRTVCLPKGSSFPDYPLIFRGNRKFAELLWSNQAICGGFRSTKPEARSDHNGQFIGPVQDLN